MEPCLPKSEIDDDIEEEETLFYTDFDTVLDDGMFQQNSLFKVIALESDEPFLQIGTQMYSGKWQDTVGTQLFFEPEATSPPSDPVFSDVPNTLLKYKFKTRKCLELSRVFINQNGGNFGNVQSLKTRDMQDNTMEIECGAETGDQVVAETGTLKKENNTNGLN